MPAPYNLTRLQGSETVTDLVITANEASELLIVGGFTLAVFLVMLLAMRKYKFTTSLTTASWVSFILSLFLRQAGLIADIWMIGYGVLAGFAMVMMYWTNK